MEDKYKLENGYNIESVCDLAIHTYGHKHQRVKAIEELGELVQALSRSILGGNHNVEEETADVEIMIYQLKKLFSVKGNKGPKPTTIHGVYGIMLIIGDLSCLITELSRAYNGEYHQVIKAINNVDESLLHLREIYNKDNIETFKYAKLERLINNLLVMRNA